MLIGSELPHVLWGEALHTTTFVKNLKLAKGTDGRSPIELLSSHAIDVRFLRVWGCKALVHIPEDKQKGKLAPRAIEGTFLGYGNTTTYRFLVDGMLAVSSYATFFEEEKGSIIATKKGDLIVPDLLVEQGKLENVLANPYSTKVMQHSHPFAEETDALYVQSAHTQGGMNSATTNEQAVADKVVHAEDCGNGGEGGHHHETRLSMSIETEENLQNDVVEANNSRDQESAGVRHSQVYNLRRRDAKDYKRMAMGLKVEETTEHLPDEF